MRNALSPSHLPLHLKEVCLLLAAGVVRLRRHAAEDVVGDRVDVREQGESSLHLPIRQSGHARPRDEELA